MRVSSRLVSTLREIPRRSTKSSKRRTPRKALRRISKVHHSPITSSDWAIEQRMSANEAFRMGPTLPELRDRTKPWQCESYDATLPVADGHRLDRHRLRQDDRPDPGRGASG